MVYIIGYHHYDRLLMSVANGVSSSMPTAASRELRVLKNVAFFDFVVCLGC